MRLIIFSFCILLISCSKNSILHPKVGPITEGVYAIGIVKSERVYDLKFGVITSIKKYFVKEGDYVNASQSVVMDDSGIVHKSPFAGVITHLPHVAGETVPPQTTLLTMMDLTKLYLEASVEQQGALKIQKGQLVKVSFESLRSKVFEGVVKNILPRNSEFVVQIEVYDLPENILPGMNADLSIEVLKKSQAVLIPAHLLTNGHVLLIQNGKPKKVAVIIGASDGDFIEIISPALTISDELLLPKAISK